MVSYHNIFAEENYLESWHRLHAWLAPFATATLKLASLAILVTYLNAMTFGIGLMTELLPSVKNSELIDYSSAVRNVFEGEPVAILVIAMLIGAVVSFFLWWTFHKSDYNNKSSTFILLAILNLIFFIGTVVFTVIRCGKSTQMWSAILLIAIIFDFVAIQTILIPIKYLRTTRVVNYINRGVEYMRHVDLSTDNLDNSQPAGLAQPRPAQPGSTNPPRSTRPPEFYAVPADNYSETQEMLSGDP